jgi:hypothetical protein
MMSHSVFKMTGPVLSGRTCTRCPMCRGSGSQSLQAPMRRMFFVKTLGDMSSRILASFVSEHCREIETSEEINADPKNFSFPLVVEILILLCGGNIKLMLQIGTYLDGNHFLSLVKHVGGLAAITKDHYFHPEVVSDYIHLTRYHVEQYQEWPTNTALDEKLGHVGYYCLLSDNLRSLFIDYKREIETFGLADGKKWEEYELAYYKAGYVNYHMPEFLGEAMFKKIQSQYIMFDLTTAFFQLLNT